jgi:hypothetical protein
MTEPTCPRNEQAVGWALHSLEPDEEMAVLMHLPQCESCRRVAGEAEEVLSRLGASVQQVDPPPSLRDRLMTKVAQTPQQSVPQPPTAAIPTVPPPAQPTAPIPPVASAPSTEPVGTPAVPPRRESDRGRTRPPDNRPGRGGSGWSRRARRLVAGALALVAVLAIGGLAVRNAQLTAERDAQIAQSQNLENLLDRFGRPGTEHALLAREDGTTIAAVVVENGRPGVFPIDMPANAIDRETYVLWGVAEGANPAPLGTFDVAGNDEGLLAIDGSSPGSEDYAAYAISLEPGRSAPAVPTQVVASGPVAA